MKVKSSQTLDSVQFQTITAWREWLKMNHKTSKGVWLVYFKKGTGSQSPEYSETVEEALCFGWVDSIIKNLDHERYARKFTPRKPNSKWSKINKKRALELIASGKMEPAGLKLVQEAQKSGSWDSPVSSGNQFEMPPDFSNALEQNSKAKGFFDSLASSYQNQYKGWIAVAKREETRQKRIKESLALLEKGEKLGMK